MSGDFTQDGVPYQSVPTYSDPYQDILSEDAVIFAPTNANVNNSNGVEDSSSAGAAASVGNASPTRSIRSLSGDRLERGERDPLLSAGISSINNLMQSEHYYLYFTITVIDVAETVYDLL